jgi:hypothetical protein
MGAWAIRIILGFSERVLAVVHPCIRGALCDTKGEVDVLRVARVAHQVCRICESMRTRLGLSRTRGLPPCG